VARLTGPAAHEPGAAGRLLRWAIHLVPSTVNDAAASTGAAQSESTRASAYAAGSVRESDPLGTAHCGRQGEIDGSAHQRR
jgi:Tfp pilus assembly protein PilV